MLLNLGMIKPGRQIPNPKACGLGIEVCTLRSSSGKREEAQAQWELVVVLVLVVDSHTKSTRIVMSNSN